MTTVTHTVLYAQYKNFRS